MAKKKMKIQKTETLTERQMPEVKKDEHLLIMSADEVFSLIKILSFSRDIFKQMSLNSAVEGDKKAEEVYAARSQLSEILYHKIQTSAGIGEPTSRIKH